MQGDVLLDPATLVVRRGIPAQHLLDRVRDQRRVGDQLGALVGYQSSATTPLAMSLAVVSCPAMVSSSRRYATCSWVSATSLPSSSRTVDGEEQRRDVVAQVARLLVDDLHEQHHDGAHRLLRRVADVALFVGFGAVEDGVGVAAQLFPGLHREPEHLRDDHHRQVGGELGDDVDLARVASVVEHTGGDGAHLGLEVGDRTRREES